MPSHPLKNPFEIPKERDPNQTAFVESVLSKGASKPKIPKEDSGIKADDLVLSAEDQKRIEDEQIFGEIISRESRALRNFFGKEIQVPPLPRQATKERILEWRGLCLELHYLPSVSMTEIRRGSKGGILQVIPFEFPGWKKKPGRQYTPKMEHGIEFFEEIRSGDLDPSALDLPGAWVLVDAREKPNFTSRNQQMYANDPLVKALEEFWQNQIAQDIRIKASRFNLSREELGDPKLLEAFAKALNLHTIPGLVLGIPRAIEFNLLGNIHYPQWDESDTSEWFSDMYQNDSVCLFGGHSSRGGLSYIDWNMPMRRSDIIGFRILVRFSSDQEEAHNN